MTSYHLSVHVSCDMDMCVTPVARPSSLDLASLCTATHPDTLSPTANTAGRPLQYRAGASLIVQCRYMAMTFRPRGAPLRARLPAYHCISFRNGHALQLRWRCIATSAASIKPSSLACSSISQNALPDDDARSSLKASRRHKPYTQQEIDSILQLARRGFSWSAIAKEIDRSTSTAVRCFWYANLRSTYGLYTSAFVERSLCENASKRYHESEDRALLLWMVEPTDRRMLAALAKDMGRSLKSMYSRTTYLKPLLHSLDTSYYRLRSRSRPAITPLEAMSVVYLRGRGIPWTGIANLFPERSLRFLRKGYSVIWRARYSDFVMTDPRTWTEEQLTAAVRRCPVPLPAGAQAEDKLSPTPSERPTVSRTPETRNDEDQRLD